MDLLSRRYASPFLLLEEMASQGRLFDFVIEVNRMSDEDKMWDIWLHKVFDKSFDDWKHSVTPVKKIPVTRENIEKTVAKSFEMLQNFNPE